MGNFYVNFTVRTEHREVIGDLLAGRDAYVSSVRDGVVLVYDKVADTQDWALIQALAGQLSEHLATAVLAVLNHDDDILMYGLFERGEETDSYNSSPDYFEDTSHPRGPQGGNAKVLCRAFGVTETDTVQAVLSRPDVAVDDDGYVFALDRHQDLMQTLGLTSQAYSAGYRHLDAREYPPDMNENDFIAVGGAR